MTSPLDHALFLWINAGSAPSPLLLQMAIFWAKWLVFSLPFLLSALWLWGRHVPRAVLVKSLLAVLMGIVMVQAIRLGWPYPRPFVEGLGSTHLYHVPDPSFPSNHATFCFAIAWTFLLHGLGRVGWPLFIVAVLVSWARVFLGVHFPSDMVGGCLVALGVAGLVVPLFAWHEGGHRLVVWLERLYRFVLAVPIARGWIVR